MTQQVTCVPKQTVCILTCAALISQDMRMWAGRQEPELLLLNLQAFLLAAEEGKSEVPRPKRLDSTIGGPADLKALLQTSLRPPVARREGADTLHSMCLGACLHRFLHTPPLTNVCGLQHRNSVCTRSTTLQACKPRRASESPTQGCPLFVFGRACSRRRVEAGTSWDGVGHCKGGKVISRDCELRRMHCGIPRGLSGGRPGSSSLAHMR